MTVIPIDHRPHDPHWTMQVQMNYTCNLNATRLQTCLVGLLMADPRKANGITNSASVGKAVVFGQMYVTLCMVTKNADKSLQADHIYSISTPRVLLETPMRV